MYEHKEYWRARPRGLQPKYSLGGIVGSVSPKTLTKDPSTAPIAVTEAIGGRAYLILLGQH